MAKETPNPETVAALEEGDRMLSDPNTKRFKSVEGLFEDLETDEYEIEGTLEFKKD